MTQFIAPGATEPEDGLNCAPEGELEAVQSKFPVELELLLSLTVQVVSCPVAELQLVEDCTSIELVPPPKLHAVIALIRTMRVRTMQSFRNM